MLRKGLFGLFGKEGDKKEPQESPESEAEHIISHDDIIADDDIIGGEGDHENPEDIISKLAQINSIIGQEETEGTDTVNQLFAHANTDSEPEPVEEARHQTAEAPDADTIQVAAGSILKAFPEDSLSAPVDEIIAQYGKTGDFIFPFRQSEIMYGLASGKIEMKLGELVNKFPFDVFSENVAAAYDQLVALPLVEILPLVPPAWFVVREQDCSKEEMVNEMEDLFPDLPTTKPSEESAAPEEDDLDAPMIEETALEEVSPVAEDEPDTVEIPAEEVQAAIPVVEEVAETESPDIEQVVLEAPTAVEPAPVDAAVDEPTDTGPDVMAIPETEMPETPVEPEVEITEPELIVPAEIDEPAALGAIESSPGEPVPATVEQATPEIVPPVVEVEETAPVVKIEPAQPEAAVDVQAEEEIDIAIEAVTEAVEETTEPPVVQKSAVAVPDATPAEQIVPLEPASEAVVTEQITPDAVLPEVLAPAPAEAVAAKPEPTLTAEVGLADEVRQAAEEIFAPSDQVPIGNVVHDEAAKEVAATVDAPIEWRSQAPNGIDINRCGIEELCLLGGVGSHLATIIIDHREKYGRFGALKDLLKISGLGSHTYRSMAKLSARADIRTAELRVNQLVGIDSESISLNRVTEGALAKFQLDAVFVSSMDGLVLAKATKNDTIAKLSDSLSAVAPQLYKRGKKALKQGLLPASDMFTFYIGKKSVTFLGSDQIFLACVHGADFPNQKQLKQCRKLATELVWYCSYRAVIG